MRLTQSLRCTVGVTIGSHLPTYKTDYFTLFGLERTSTIDTEKLKTNYRKFQLLYHPDNINNFKLPLTSNDSSNGSLSSTHEEYNNNNNNNKQSDESMHLNTVKDILYEASSYASAAYHTLRDPYRRCRFLAALMDAEEYAIDSGTVSIPLLPTQESYYLASLAADDSEKSRGKSKSNEGKIMEGDNNNNNNNNEYKQGSHLHPSEEKKGNGNGVSSSATSLVAGDEEFLMEMMELNEALHTVKEALDTDGGSHTNVTEETLAALKAVEDSVNRLLSDHQCEAEKKALEACILRERLLVSDSVTRDREEGGGKGKEELLLQYRRASKNFKACVLKWTYTYNLQRQINELK